MTKVVINDDYLVRGTFALFNEPLFFIPAICQYLGLLVRRPWVCFRHPEDQLSPLFQRLNSNECNRRTNKRSALTNGCAWWCRSEPANHKLLQAGWMSEVWPLVFAFCERTFGFYSVSTDVVTSHLCLISICCRRQKYCCLLRFSRALVATALFPPPSRSGRRKASDTLSLSNQVLSSSRSGSYLKSNPVDSGADLTGVV